MKILLSEVINPYRSHRPLGFYNLLKGHTGVDLRCRYEQLESPITGKVMAILKQKEMGTTVYLKDYVDNIHIFSHLSSLNCKVGDKVKRGDRFVTTGNSGAKSTAPHLHYEIITKVPLNQADKKMTRTLYSFKGYNTDPILYLKTLYKLHNLKDDGTPAVPPYSF